MSRWDEVAGTFRILKKSEIYFGDKKAQIAMNKNRKGIDRMIERKRRENFSPGILRHLSHEL